MLAEPAGYTDLGHLAPTKGRIHVTQTCDQPNPRVEAACSLINECLGDDLSLTVLAKAAGLSAFHFLRTFRAMTGMTPKRYVLHRRLERASDRLVRTTVPISRIARDLAFANPSHLASAFRVRFGCTPTEYRRRFGAKGPLHRGGDMRDNDDRAVVDQTISDSAASFQTLVQ